MKYFGFALLLFAVFVCYLAWNDNVEGPPVRMACYLGMAAGIYCYFEGLKSEIIVGLRGTSTREIIADLTKLAEKKPGDKA